MMGVFSSCRHFLLANDGGGVRGGGGLVYVHTVLFAMSFLGAIP